MERRPAPTRRRREALAAGWLRDAIARSPTCVLLLDADGVVADVVGDASAVLGAPVERLADTSLRTAVAAEHAERLGWVLQQCLRTGDPGLFEGPFRFGADRRVLEVVVAPAPPGTEPATYVATTTDVTVGRRAQRLLTKPASFDTMTGLVTRSVLLKAAERHLRDTGTPAALVVVDIARFRLVNEAHGPTVGDRLLVAIGRRLKEALGPRDVVARLGGDEFAALVVDLGVRPTVDAAVDRISAAIHREPVRIRDLELDVRAWIGTQLLGPDDEPARALQQAVSAAADARERRTRTVVADDELRRRAAVRAELLADLPAGLAQGQFTLLHQPIVDPRSGRVVSTEALARWEHPRHGRIGPNEFVPLAEESGAIGMLGQVALDHCLAARTAFEQLWRDPPSVAVNVSPLQLLESDWLSIVRARLAVAGRSAEGLTFELTESVAHEAADVVAGLRALGGRVVIDDFGTGYSSLSLLQRIHVDGLKVDRSFTQRITEDPGALTLVRAVLALATALGLDATVEGVETAEERDLLLELGATRCQGHLWHAPLPLDDVLALGG